ncbi:hypothetical protein CBW16_09850 [Flavobacteriaceae bacterium JJC]|uniref:hypothetical protein n=1 Tax=Kaistella soli TaxID=2849654 RepID=UPI000B4BD28A|nr:hypothetical protein [Kaistella soli]MBU8883016.1 hypothetical protein [Kaistella soli]OWK73840.1 hypothetical protein CBW16_09850 [Flavobacteriaceae bacterium JJC]
MENLYEQILWLFILAVPVACIAWTVTHEEIFREPREYCVKKSQECRELYKRKFFYLFTCEYCFSHYITAIILIITKYRLLFDDWRGYLISFFALVFVANVYMSLFAFLRQSIKVEKIEAKLKDNELQEVKKEGGA